jgi:hypothetical protein
MFYKAYWPIMKNEVLAAVHHFGRTGHLPKQRKSTLITLIPKVENPSKPSDFRLISLCNVSYKRDCQVAREQTEAPPC